MRTGWVQAGALGCALGVTPAQARITSIEITSVDPFADGAEFGAARGDAAGGANPAGGTIGNAVALGISRSGRHLRDFIHRGLNRDAAGHRVFDGVLSHMAGIGGVFLNARLGQPSRTNTQHEDHLSPENAFPFSATAQHDPVTGRTGALLGNDGFDPLLIKVNTGTAYWPKGASLLTTDPLGLHARTLHDRAPAYLVWSAFHYGRAGLTSTRGPCAHRRSTLNPAPALRALLIVLEEWVTEGRILPDSRISRLSDGTLVEAAGTSSSG